MRDSSRGRLRLGWRPAARVQVSGPRSVWKRLRSGIARLGFTALPVRASSSSARMAGPGEKKGGDLSPPLYLVAFEEWLLLLLCSLLLGSSLLLCLLDGHVNPPSQRSEPTDGGCRRCARELVGGWDPPPLSPGRATSSWRPSSSPSWQPSSSLALLSIPPFGPNWTYVAALYQHIG